MEIPGRLGHVDGTDRPYARALWYNTKLYNKIVNTGYSYRIFLTEINGQLKLLISTEVHNETD